MKNKIKPNPLFIGLEIPTANGVIKVFIGIDQEDGHEVSYIEENASKLPENPWRDGAKMSILRGTEGRVFNNKHNLIEHIDTPACVYNIED